MFSYLLKGITLGLSAAATPGPFQAYLLGQTLKNGWKRTLIAAFAPLFSDIPIITLVLFILTQTPDWFLKALQIIGGFFILYLAYGAYQSYQKTDDTAFTTQESTQSKFIKATLMNFLNPNPYIYWGTVSGVILLDGWRESPLFGVAYLTGFYIFLIGGFIGFIILAGTTRQFGEKAVRILRLISAIALALFGLYQVTTGMIAILPPA